MKEDYKKAIKVTALAQAFIDALDDFGGSTHFKHQLKNKGLSFSKEVDKFLNQVYKDGGAEIPFIAILEEIQKAAENVIDNQIEVVE